MEEYEKVCSKNKISKKLIGTLKNENEKLSNELEQLKYDFKCVACDKILLSKEIEFLKLSYADFQIESVVFKNELEKTKEILGKFTLRSRRLD